MDEGDVCIPPRMHLSSENIDRHGLYLMDCGEAFYMWVGRSISDIYLNEVFNVKSFAELPEVSYELPDLENELSEKVRQFIAYLYDTRPFGIKFLCFREGSHQSSLFFEHLHDDKTENSISYFEFLKHLSDQLNS
ncbi:transport Sec24A-like [Brachionus plicatilis]|uniref:Transport Sec24A-like n=1 Tax=Brachionus plicatilis TaxID=10195 RepID=A0A3M7Q035_BRAPC|nr:transport Sec24A-like [Brachionus plicatilis]